MPFREGVDDDEPLKNLIALWEQADAELAQRRNTVVGRLDRILAGAESTDPVDRAIVERRLRQQLRRLDELTAAAKATAGELVGETGAWINAGGMDRIYAAGAGVTATATGIPFTFSAPHRAAADVLAQDTFDDVLKATEFVDAEAKGLIREVSRVLGAQSITVGDTALQQARKFTREMRGLGMGTVTYANGRRVPMGEYAEMLLRTKTAVAYNAGTTNQAVVVGIEVFEILDGDLCGLRSHNDSQRANQLLVGVEMVNAYPIAHPRCRRSINPRPDLNKSAIGKEFRSVQSEPARRDQAAFEEQLRLEQRNRTNRRQRRARRQRQRNTTRNTTTARSTPRRVQPDPAVQAAAREAARPGREQQIRAARRRLERNRRVALAEETGIDATALIEFPDVDPADLIAARPLVAQIKREIREQAKLDAEEMNQLLVNAGLDSINRPPRFVTRVRPTDGTTYRTRDDPGWEFLEFVGKSEEERIRRRYGSRSGPHSPDVLAEEVRRFTKATNWQDEEAIEWLRDQWLREDGLRSVASGRLPKFIDDVEAMMPGAYADQGYELEQLFGQVRDLTTGELRIRTVDEAAAHVATVQKDQMVRFARVELPETELGPAPWRMTLDDYVFELEYHETSLANLTPGEEGFDAAVEYTRNRIRELAPSGLDDGSLSPFELHERITDLARRGSRE